MPYDTVYVGNFGSGPCWLPGVVTVKTGPLSYVVQLSDGRVVRRHQDHVRKRTAVVGPGLQRGTVGVPSTDVPEAGAGVPNWGPAGDDLAAADVLQESQVGADSGDIARSQCDTGNIAGVQDNTGSGDIAITGGSMPVGTAAVPLRRSDRTRTQPSSLGDWTV